MSLGFFLRCKYTTKYDAEYISASKNKPFVEWTFNIYKVGGLRIIGTAGSLADV
jgi:hypothetical protein